MATYYKPQSPIQSGEDFIYPITTADQIMKSDKTRRLEQAGLIVADNSTSLGGVAAKDYALKTDTAPDSAKLGGKAPEYYTNPRNLLDNSDFRNPVNQRGIYSATNGSYIIDRWYFYNSKFTGNVTITQSANGITITNDAGADTVAIVQRFIDKNYYDEKYTAVAKTTDGLVFGYVEVVDSENSVCQMSIWLPNGATVVWAALYEGSYTAETLPPYVSKGKHVEMLNCGVSLTPHNLLDNSDFLHPVNQRGAASGNYSWNYAIDRWMLNGSGFVIDDNGITIPAGGRLVQRHKAGMITTTDGKTLAVQLADGSVFSTTSATQYGNLYLSKSSTNEYSTANIENKGSGNITVKWAALYEGSYTADTLPPYVPKGYAAEFAECRRYFRRYTAGNASLILSGFVSAGTKEIYVNAPERAPMRTKKVSIAYSGSGVIIRGVSGYATECSGSSIYGDISITPHQSNSSFCAGIIITKKDGTTWGLTNNTLVNVAFAANGKLDYIADL